MKKAAGGIRPYGCLTTRYYNAAAPMVSYLDSVPTRVWATKMTLPGSQAVTVCTAWTVKVNFEWTPDSLKRKDTLYIFIREATPPYTQIYFSKWITQLGNNYGEIEIDPPVPPYAIPRVSPKRDVFVGLYIAGGAGDNVKWKVQTPAANPGRSYFFNTPTSVAPAVMGTTAVDWVFDATWCCNFAIPVELSVFVASFDGEAVNLEWKTESEINNYHFEVQRSASNNGPWETRTFIPGVGNSSAARWYSWKDRITQSELSQPAYWYRLRQMDFDGTIHEYDPVRVNISNTPSAGYQLHAAYPNPITQSEYTTIGFDLPDESPVNVSVYDAIGRNVATLVDQVLPAGYHETIWYSSNARHALNEGAYFIVMKTGMYTATRKITLLN